MPASLTAAAAPGARPWPRWARTGRAMTTPRQRLRRDSGLTVPGTVKSYTPDHRRDAARSARWGLADALPQLTPAGATVPLTQITTKNVGGLQLKWAWPLEDGMRQQITPIVHDGVMFLSTNMTNTVQALDARTGDLIWEHRLGPVGTAGQNATRTMATVRQLVVLSGNRRHVIRARCTHRKYRLEEQDVRIPR